LLGLAKANAELVLDLQCRRPVKTATLDIDATVIACDKRAAKRAYDGNRGYQPVLALWAEQDVIIADEFRDGNVPAGSGNRRVVEKALAALPGGFDKIGVAILERGAEPVETRRGLPGDPGDTHSRYIEAAIGGFAFGRDAGLRIDHLLLSPSFFGAHMQRRTF
jgi:hypothetical protein